MTLQKGNLKGLAILEDSASQGVPVTNGTGDGGDILLELSAAHVLRSRPVSTHWVSGFLESNCSQAQPATANPGSYNHATTGTAASATLTTGSDQTSDLGTGYVAAVLLYDGSYRFANITSVTSTTCVLEYPLSYYFPDAPTGSLAVTIYGRWESTGNSQHLSDAGNRAYADLLLNTSPVKAVQGNALRFIAAGEEFETQPWTQASPQTWHVAGGATGNEINHRRLANINSNDAYHTTDNYALELTTTAAGEYATYTTKVDGRSCWVSFVTGIRTGYSSATYGVAKVFADGEEIYSEDFYTSVRRHFVQVVGATEIEIRVQQVGAGSPTLRIGDLAILAAEPCCEKILPRDGTALLMGDSWLDELGNGGTARVGFADYLREQTQLEVVSTYARGGTTIKYGWEWLETAVKATGPDVVIFHYGINDSNSIGGTTLSNENDPDGSSFDINIADGDEYWGLVSKCIGFCLNRGISVVFMGYPGTASTSQTQAAANNGLLLGDKHPVLLGEHINEATDNEISNDESRVNLKGKYAGRTLLNVENSTVYYATGSGATDDWEPLNTSGTAITPA